MSRPTKHPYRVELTEHRDGHTQTSIIQRVFEQLLQGPGCIAGVAIALHAEKSTVSARMNELKGIEELRYHGQRYELELKGKWKWPPTDKKVEYWQAVPWRPKGGRQTALAFAETERRAGV